MHTVTSQAILDCQTQETQEYHCSIWEVLSSDVLKIFAHENVTCVTFLMPASCFKPRPSTPIHIALIPSQDIGHDHDHEHLLSLCNIDMHCGMHSCPATVVIMWWASQPDIL